MRELLYKTMFMLTIVASFGVMLYGPNGPAVPFNPQIPKFTLTNPMDAVYQHAVLIPVANGTVFPQDKPMNVTNCLMSAYFYCMDPGGTAGKYLSISGIGLNNNNVTVKIDSPLTYGGAQAVITTQIAMFCNSTDNNTNNIGMYFSDLDPPLTGISYAPSISCKTGPMRMQFLNDSSAVNAGLIYVNFSTRYVQIFTGSDLVNIGLFYITLGLSAQNRCTNTNSLFGVICVMQNVGTVILQIFATIWVGIVTFFLFIGGWTVFIFQTIANYITILIWLYTIPGLPFILQTLVSSIVTLWIAIIGIELYKALWPFE